MIWKENVRMALSGTNRTSDMNKIAEGFPAISGMHHVAALPGVRMPGLSTVYRVLYQNGSLFSI